VLGIDKNCLRRNPQFFSNSKVKLHYFITILTNKLQGRPNVHTLGEVDSF